MGKQKRPKRIRKKNDDKIYLTNEKFLKVLEDFLEQRKENPDLNCTPELGELFILLVNKLASKHNFSGYTFLDDMKAEALMQCVWKAKNFDPTKSKNPFSYFTTIIYNSFIKIIKEEKGQSQLKDTIFKDLQDELYNSNDIKLNLKTQFDPSKIEE
jgi:DNA-directed RNA polymerase specialized sigma subunit